VIVNKETKNGFLGIFSLFRLTNSFTWGWPVPAVDFKSYLEPPLGGTSSELPRSIWINSLLHFVCDREIIYCGHLGEEVSWFVMSVLIVIAAMPPISNLKILSRSRCDHQNHSRLMVMIWGGALAFSFKIPYVFFCHWFTNRCKLDSFLTTWRPW
jgi:hypothetical protein